MAAFKLSGVCVRSFFLVIVGAHVLYSKVLEYNLMSIGDTAEVSITVESMYIFRIDATDAYKKYSSFVFQVHTTLSNVSLTNFSSGCTVPRDCSTVGAHVGMVQLLAFPETHTLFNFSMVYFHLHGNGSNETQQVLIAAMGILHYNPIPGGCSLTSALEIDAMLSLTSAESASNTTMTFQDSDIGFSPLLSGQPACSDGAAHVTELQYKVYQKCYKSPSTSELFGAIRSLMTPDSFQSSAMSFRSFSAMDAKKLVYMTRRRQTFVINVLASDITSGRNTSAYIPNVFTWCNDGSSHCSHSISIPVIVCAPILGLIGLFLCLLAHRFFHAEVVLFSSLISCYVVYFILSVSVDWNDTEFLVATLLLGLALTVLLFTLWFFSNCCGVFLGLFSVSMSFSISASILFILIGYVALLRVWYLYLLVMFCGLVIFIMPLILFPTALNIVSSSVVGSYAVIYSVGLFVDSYLTEIILEVVHNAAIPGYLAASSRCELSILDIVLFLIWVLLFVVSVSTQAIFEKFRRKSFKKNEEMKMKSWHSSCARPKTKQYAAFPSTSLCTQLVKVMKEKYGRRGGELYSATNNFSRTGERQPLLSPHSIDAQHSSAMQKSSSVYGKHHS